MSLSDQDLARIRELIELDRTSHDATIEQRFSQIDLRLKDFDHDLKGTRRAMVGIFDVIQEDLKPKIDSLVSDQRFVRNVRTFLIAVVVPLSGAVAWFWPHLAEFLKTGKW